MSPTIVPYILMIALVIGHTVAIQFLKKKRNALDVSTPEGAKRAKSFSLIITILYIEIPVLTALIWFFLAPLFVPVDN